MYYVYMVTFIGFSVIYTQCPLYPMYATVDVIFDMFLEQQHSKFWDFMVTSLKYIYYAYQCW